MKTMTENIARREYWTEKYKAPEWGEDMHFGLFYPEAGDSDFNGAIRSNTQRVCDEILELASVYRLSMGISVLDFGCGTGDLVQSLAQMLDNVKAVGIDISQTAIDIATHRSNEASLPPLAIKFIVGEVDEVERRAACGESFDVIVCRDMYYLLDRAEQARLLGAFRQLLSPGGLFYIADLVVEHGSIALVHDTLIKRQHGGVPITWLREKGEVTYSIVQEAEFLGFALTRPPQREDAAVKASYLAAASLASEATGQVFRRLAEIASHRVNGGVTMPYLRCFFRSPPLEQNLGHEVGLRMEADVAFQPGRVILRRGICALPYAKWSLVIGRSGSGKTTLLNLLAGFQSIRGVTRMLPDHNSLFLLAQEPLLIEELSVLDNIRLYARNPAAVPLVLKALGLHPDIASRRADKRLSGGEAQRVALGQAIVAEPGILLLDEPTTGVDLPRKKEFFAALRRAFENREITVVCVDHDFVSIARYFDVVFEIIDGQLVAMEPHGSAYG